MSYGSLNFNSLGPHNDIFLNAARHEQRIKDWVTEHCRRHQVRRDGLAGLVYRAVDEDRLTEDEAHLLVRSFFSAGVDTTVDGIANALHCFAENPEQWTRFRQNPSLVRNAFEEALRLKLPFQTFFRTTTRDTEIAGMQIEADQKIMISVGSANRDPRRWADPDRFDVERKNAGQLAFGVGIHSCVGQVISRLEGEALLGELAKRIRCIENAGPPQT